jgi:rhodanese-related sulfurtransferase
MKKIIASTLIGMLIFSINLYAAKAITDNAKAILEEAKKHISFTTPQEMKKFIDDDVDFIQVDVREDNESGHGEIWSMEKIRLTRGYIEYKIEHAVPNKNAKIVVVCCSGKRAILAAQTMKKLGFKDVSYLQGGVRGWLKAGYPLDTVFGELYLKD